MTQVSPLSPRPWCNSVSRKGSLPSHSSSIVNLMLVSMLFRCWWNSSTNLDVGVNWPEPDWWRIRGCHKGFSVLTVPSTDWLLSEKMDSLLWHHVSVCKSCLFTWNTCKLCPESRQNINSSKITYPEGLTSPPLKKASDGRKLGKCYNIQSQLLVKFYLIWQNCDQKQHPCRYVLYPFHVERT